MSKKFHVAFGAYGIIEHAGSLLVIRKNAGPYINRFDLPGGSLDEGEPLQNIVGREIKEETGLTVTNSKQLGTISFRYPWNYQHFTWNEHICVFYDIPEYIGAAKQEVVQFVGQDSYGSNWVKLDQINSENSSPLVLKAKEYCLQGQFVIKDETFEEWELK